MKPEGIDSTASPDGGTVGSGRSDEHGAVSVRQPARILPRPTKPADGARPKGKRQRSGARTRRRNATRTVRGTLVGGAAGSYIKGRDGRNYIVAVDRAYWGRTALTWWHIKGGRATPAVSGSGSALAKASPQEHDDWPPPEPALRHRLEGMPSKGIRIVSGGLPTLGRRR